MQAVFDHLLDAVGRNKPHELPSIEVLLEALADAKVADGHSDHFRRGIEAVVLDSDLRGTIWLGLAIHGLPGASAETSQAYATLAVDLSRWVRDSAKRADTPEKKDIVRRVEQRIRIARLYSTGWAALAAGAVSDYVTAPVTTYAMALGAEIEAATATRAVLPEPESREETAILREGWHNRISGLYGHLGVGYVAAGPGWYGLIEDALEAIDASLRPEDRAELKVSDVKEKYGTLRIYVDGAPDVVEAIIEVAERRSAATCDRCSDHGRVGGRSWLACRCGRHEQQ